MCVCVCCDLSYNVNDLSTHALCKVYIGIPRGWWVEEEAQWCLYLLGFGKLWWGWSSLGRLVETGTQVLLTWVWHSKPRFLQQLLHLMFIHSFFAWFPQSAHFFIFLLQSLSYTSLVAFFFQHYYYYIIYIITYPVTPSILSNLSSNIVYASLCI